MALQPETDLVSLPREFVLEVLVRGTVPLLQDEAWNENLILYAVDSGASLCRKPETALRQLLMFWNVGFRPGEEGP